MTDLIGAHLGPYDIQGMIRQGGMATIFKAYQPSLERLVAVKVMTTTTDAEFIARFQREARAVAQLQHPNIVQMYDYGNYNNHIYLVMQYIEDGRSLLDLHGKMLPLVNALRMTVHILSALSHAHAKSIIHRDIKPSNILIAGDMWPMLIDFGIAKLLNDTQNLTRVGLAVGTPAYMSPEQAEGRPVDGRSDLYALGIVLYELVTGQVPFSAETPMALLMKHVYSPPPAPRTVKPDLPASVEALLLRVLSKDPAARYQSADEMAHAINLIIQQIEQGPSPSTLVNLYQLGQQAMRTGQWEDAIGHLSRLVDLDPHYHDAPDLLRVALVAQQRIQTDARIQSVANQGTPPPRTPTPPQPVPQLQPTTGQSSTPNPQVAANLEPAPIVLTRATTATARPVTQYVLWGIGALVVLALVGWLASRFLGGTPPIEPTAQPTELAVAATNAPDVTSAPLQPTQNSTAAATSAPASTPASGATSAPAPEPAGTLAYETDFQNGAAETAKSGLKDERDDPVFQHGFHAPGVYHMLLLNPNEAQHIVLPRFAYSNMTFQTDTWDNSDTLDGSAVAGVIFRVRDDTHFYTVLLDPRKGQYAIRKLDGENTWTDLVAWKPSPLIKRRTEVNQLRVDADGDTFTIYLNGKQLDQVKDSSYSFGMLGMLVINTDAPKPHIHYDNMKIWSNDPPPATPELPLTRANPNGDMVLIQAGEFILGGTESSDAAPQIVALKDFYIDRSEATNGAYGRCVEAKKCTPLSSPASATHPNYATDALYADYPVINVTWTQAEAFCGWAAKRLPSEAEWEKAASWNVTTRTKTIWPWGNEFDPTKVNTDEGRNGDTTKIGQFGAELNGTVDMGGNVSEWTSTLFKPFPYIANDGREDLQASGDRVYRGGSWAQTAGKAQNVIRFNTTVDYQDREIGFRCAANP